MKQRTILLAEDNLQDETPALRTLKQNNVLNTIDMVRDSVDALNYLFCQSQYAERDPAELPTAVLVNIKLPKVSSLKVLEHLR